MGKELDTFIDSMLYMTSVNAILGVLGGRYNFADALQRRIDARLEELQQEKMALTFAREFLAHKEPLDTGPFVGMTRYELQGVK